MYWIKGQLGVPVNLGNATSITISQNGSAYDVLANLVNGNTATIYSGTLAAATAARGMILDALVSVNSPVVNPWGADFKLFLWPGIGQAFARTIDEAMAAMAQVNTGGAHTITGTRIDGVQVQIVDSVVGRFGS